MKKIAIIVLAILVSSAGYSQQILKWSVSEAKVTCGDIVKASYSLLVSIGDQSNSPVLGSSTMRFIYDAGVLKNFSIQNIENGYYKSGLHESNPVLGEIFGFSNSEGVLVQFDLMDNARVNPIKLSTKPTHVLDFSFEIDSDAKYPLCTPIVLDNNPDGWLQGITKDDGYIPGSAGIVGSYFLNQDFGKAYDADDEVTNLSWKKSNEPINIFSWKKSNEPIGKIIKGKNIGKINKSLCIQKNICKELDSDKDVIPDMLVLDLKGNEVLDNGENGINLENILDQSENKLFKIYPVPFYQRVFVEYSFDYDTNVTLEVFDAKGTLISKIVNREYIKESLYNERIDLSRTNAQLLFVRLTTNKNSETTKIVALATNR